MFPENIPLHYVYPELVLTAEDQDYKVGDANGDTTCKEIVCEILSDPKGIIDCSAELNSLMRYDINIKFNKLIDNVDFEEDKYVFEIGAKVGISSFHTMLPSTTSDNNPRIEETIVVVKMRLGPTVAWLSLSTSNLEI